MKFEQTVEQLEAVIVEMMPPDKAEEMLEQTQRCQKLWQDGHLDEADSILHSVGQRINVLIDSANE